jgi:hypothetical protein
MDGTTEENGEDILQRILALLFSLADIAAAAASRSYPVRCYLLWLLRRGEPYAWRCIMRECGYDAGAPLPRSLRTPLLLVILNTPADALRIAETYRALARALKKQLQRNARLARRQARWEPGELNIDAEIPSWREFGHRLAYHVQAAFRESTFQLALARVVAPP